MPYCYNCFREHSGPGSCPHCGYDAERDNGKFPQALPHGSILAGQYITGRVLGQGGFGITYLALDRKNNRRVAVKEFLPDTMAGRSGSLQVTAYSGDRGTQFQYGLDCFLEEAKTLARFLGMPNIVGVYSYFQENGTAYFAMEYIEGISLKNHLRSHGGRLGWEETARLLLPVMDALEEVHRAGLIHRDVTPDNIYLAGDGSVKLLDFGAARYSLGNRSRSLDVVLKPGYAPKEQYTRHGRQGPYTDIYSLGACFYAAMTGVLPPEAPDRMEEDDLIPPTARGIKLPPPLEDAILKALEVQPYDRYQSVAEFRSAIRYACPTPLIPESEAIPVLQSESALSPASEPVPVPQTEAVPHTETEPAPVLRPEPVPHTKTEPTPVPQAESVPAPEPKPNPVPVPAPKPEPEIKPGETKKTNQKAGQRSESAPVPKSVPTPKPSEPSRESKKTVPEYNTKQTNKWILATGGVAAALLVVVLGVSGLSSAGMQGNVVHSSEPVETRQLDTPLTESQPPVGTETPQADTTAPVADVLPVGPGSAVPASEPVDIAPVLPVVPSETPAASSAPSAPAVSTPTPSASVSPSDPPSVSASPSPSPTPSPSVSPSPSSSPSPSASLSLTLSPSVSPSPSPTPSPSVSPPSEVTSVRNESYTMVTSLFSVSGVYTGDWKDGKPHGSGTLTIHETNSRWNYGDTLWSSSWSNGLIEGYGQWRSAVDGAYDGNFSGGIKSGYGKMWFSDGTIKDGQWSGGEFVG